MQSVKTKKLAISAIFVAVAVVGSVFIQFPFLGSNCSPTPQAGPSAPACCATCLASAR